MVRVIVAAEGPDAIIDGACMLAVAPLVHDRY